MFRGQLYAGRLYAGRLFGVEETVTPQVDLPLEYHGGGEDLVEKVLAKWETIERARRRRFQVEVVPEFVSEAEPGNSGEVPEFEAAVEPGNSGVAEAAAHGAQVAPIIQPVYQFTREEPVRVAPTKSMPATVQADDGMEEIMAVLLALEEAGEL